MFWWKDQCFSSVTLSLFWSLCLAAASRPEWQRPKRDHIQAPRLQNVYLPQKDNCKNQFNYSLKVPFADKLSVWRPFMPNNAFWQNSLKHSTWTPQSYFHSVWTIVYRKCAKNKVRVFPAKRIWKVSSKKYGSDALLVSITSSNEGWYTTISPPPKKIPPCVQFLSHVMLREAII